jgi:hypothetical protein
MDYNPASVGQLPSESTAVIIFERPDGDRNYAARDFSSSRFPRASCSACHGLETPTQNDVEGREIDFLAVLGRVDPCASTRSSHLPDAFPPQSKSCAACSPRAGDLSRPGLGPVEAVFCAVSGGHAKGPLARRRCRTSRSGCRVTGDRGFESGFLQQRVACEPEFSRRTRFDGDREVRIVISAAAAGRILSPHWRAPLAAPARRNGRRAA